uniref:Inward rectifier potassium channel 2 n=1 Tax=Lygus hesperus TaxID=30085 RepID=A0A0A9XIE2_LYGHE
MRRFRAISKKTETSPKNWLWEIFWLLKVLHSDFELGNLGKKAFSGINASIALFSTSVDWTKGNVGAQVFVLHIFGVLSVTSGQRGLEMRCAAKKWRFFYGDR